MEERILIDKILNELKDHNELFLRFNKDNNFPTNFGKNIHRVFIKKLVLTQVFF